MCDGGIFLDELSDYQHLKYNYIPEGHLEGFRNFMQCDILKWRVFNDRLLWTLGPDKHAKQPSTHLGKSVLHWSSLLRC
jgi:hypothetical protein